MRADKLLLKYGETIIGLRVMTEAIGQYPGGPASIVEVNPDPATPEIVCNVRHDTWRTEDHPDGVIGIFEHEELEMI